MDGHWGTALMVVGQLITAIIVLLTKYDLGIVRGDVRVVKEDIREVKIETNSMKDALVASTGVAARAEGKAEGKLEERAEVADRKAIRENGNKGT